MIQRSYKPTKKALQFHASQARFIVLVGGQGSGKSRALIEELIQSGLDYPGYPMAVYRKTLPSLRDSTLHEYRGMVPNGIGQMKETSVQYEFNNGSFINFRGLDDPNKAKSTNYATIVMEEANEFTYEDFTFLPVVS